MERDHDFDKLRYFLCGVLGLENMSTLYADPEVVLTRAFEERNVDVVRFLLTDPLDPTFPLKDYEKSIDGYENKR